MHLRIASRCSIFYAPLLSAISGGFLKDAGLDAVLVPIPKGKSGFDFVEAGQAEVGQAGVVVSWKLLDKGIIPTIVHFAQINERDGFFIAARDSRKPFSWEDLINGRFACAIKGQPKVTLSYALSKVGLSFDDLRHPIDIDSISDVMTMWRNGQLDFLHQQGAFPQQLEYEGCGVVAAAVGDIVGPIAFSSLIAERSWLTSLAAQQFMGAYRRARQWIEQASFSEIAASLRIFFPQLEQEVLIRTIASYKTLGSWPASPSISEHAYEAATEIFLQTKSITKRHPYELVVAPPPDA